MTSADNVHCHHCGADLGVPKVQAKASWVVNQGVTLPSLTGIYCLECHRATVVVLDVPNDAQSR